MPNPEVIAHRGYATRYSENTLVALEAALRAGARYVEFDVQLTRDGIPVLQHDADLARTTGRVGRGMDLDLDTICALDAGEAPRFGTRFTGERIPTLAQAVDLLADRPQATAFVEIEEESLAHFGTVRAMRSVLAVLEPLLARCVPISSRPWRSTNCSRDSHRTDMSGDHHDLVVVGGGIHGAGLALAATTAGHSVLVLEPAEGIDVR